MDKPGVLLPVRYCCVSHCGRALVSHQTEPDNSYPSIVQRVIRSLDIRPLAPGDYRKLTVPVDRYQVHVLCGDHVTYCCVTQRTNQVYQPFLFLNSLRARFVEVPSLVSRASTAGEHEFDRDFGPVLAALVYDHNVGRGGNKVMSLQAQLEDVKQVMMDNVTRILERGERLDDILSKTEDLEAQGSDFRQGSRQIKSSERWKTIKMWFVILGLLGAVLTLAALFFFGIIHIND